MKEVKLKCVRRGNGRCEEASVYPFYGIPFVLCEHHKNVMQARFECDEEFRNNILAKSRQMEIVGQLNEGMMGNSMYVRVGDVDRRVEFVKSVSLREFAELCENERWADTDMCIAVVNGEVHTTDDFDSIFIVDGDLIEFIPLTSGG